MVSKTLDLDLAGLVSALDPTGGFFGHDKVEGIASVAGGRKLVISNDSDSGLAGLSNDQPPYQLQAKTLPNGQQDSGEYLVVDTRKVSADGASVPTSTGTVTITVRGGR